MPAAAKKYRLGRSQGENWGMRSNSVTEFNGDAQTVFKLLFGLTSKDSFTSPIKQNPFVMAAWKSIARNIGGIPIRVYKGDRKAVKPSDWVGSDHPLQMLIDKPSPQHISANFWGTVTAHMLEYGESPWMLLGQTMKPRGSKTETPGAIWPLNPRMTRPDRRAGEIVPRTYRSTFAQQAIVLNEQQVCRVYEADPHDETGYNAISPLMAGWVDLDSDFLASRYQEDYFANGARPGGILKSKSRLIAAKVKQMREAWESQHQGAGKQHSIAILDDGTDYQALGQTAKDMEFLSLRNWGIAVVSAITGVPKKELAMTDDMNHATALSMDRQYWTRTLIPQIRMFEDFMYCDIFRFIEGGRYYVKWDLSAVPALREDMAAQLDALAKMRDLGIRAKDGRALVGLDLPSQGEVDELQFMPANLALVEDFLAVAEEPPMDSDVPVAEIGDGEEGSTEGDPADGEAADDETDGEETQPKRIAQTPSPSVGGSSPRSRLSRAAKSLRAKKKNRARRLFKRHEEQVRVKSSKEMASKTNKWMGKMRKGVIDRAEKLAESQGFARSSQKETYKRNIGKKLVEWTLSESDIDALLGDIRSWGDALNGLMRPLYERIFKRVGGFISEEIGRDFVINAADPKFTSIIAKSRGRLVRDVADSTRLSVRDNLLKVAREGGTILDVQNSMQQMSQFSRDRANRIAWTESGMTAADARKDGLEEAGVGRHEWLTDGGVNVREAHAAMNGEIVRVGEPFSNGLMYPLGPLADGSVAPAEEVVNCNCFALAVLD